MIISPLHNIIDWVQSRSCYIPPIAVAALQRLRPKGNIKRQIRTTKKPSKILCLTHLLARTRRLFLRLSSRTCSDLAAPRPPRKCRCHAGRASEGCWSRARRAAVEGRVHKDVTLCYALDRRRPYGAAMSIRTANKMATCLHYSAHDKWKRYV